MESTVTEGMDKEADIYESDYLSADWRELFTAEGLCDFEALWGLSLEAVDKPNVGRGGWSRVFLMSFSVIAERSVSLFDTHRR